VSSKVFSYLRNILAVVGLLAVLALISFTGLMSLWRNWGAAKTVFGTAASEDGYTKVTLYQIDPGAAGATRTYVSLSNVKVDGSAEGDVILTFTRLYDEARNVKMEWKARRLLVVTYPAKAELEFAISKTRGITVEAVPN
jgi:hypothetical protein